MEVVAWAFLVDLVLVSLLALILYLMPPSFRETMESFWWMGVSGTSLVCLMLGIVPRMIAHDGRVRHPWKAW
ncbi:hypothetical protein C4577_02675 [Candidatus Parcubacteria bacterium]|nr:MAG: hypothetical protein C4577_02675 [Candidatus Parcubacteria bacterium]